MTEDLLAATVDVPNGAGARRTTVWLESGRDGFELPAAALTAGRIVASTGRSVPVLSNAAPETLPAPALVIGASALGVLPEAWPTETPGSAWRLDEGTRLRLVAGDGEAVAQGSVVLEGRRGETVRPQLDAVDASGNPRLIVVTGGARLDLAGFGDISAVVIVDEGSVLLEGTTVHGAVFVTGEIDFGATGAIAWDPDVYRWARYRSTVRVRAVPGSRGEELLSSATTTTLSGP